LAQIAISTGVRFEWPTTLARFRTARNSSSPRTFAQDETETRVLGYLRECRHASGSWPA
jgi:hypothetical protein